MFERLSTFEETIAQSADFICNERMSRLTTELLEHPDDYPRYHEIRSDVKLNSPCVLHWAKDSTC